MHRGWYDTQDMGYMDEDGYLWHVGRLARFLKIGGEMVSLVTVEDVLERAVPPGVVCSVVEVPDAASGSKIVAVVTEGVDQREVLRQMSGELPNFALPKQFVVVPEIPKMSSGKIDFRSLTETVRGLVQPRRQGARRRGAGAHRTTRMAVISSTCSGPSVTRTRRM